MSLRPTAHPTAAGASRRRSHTPRWRATAVAALAAALVACATPEAPVQKRAYDFGPSGATVRASEARLAALALASVEAGSAWEHTRLQYRLNYANPQELRPYALARWSMPPAQLVHQRVRAVLAQRGPVLAPGEGTSAYALNLELEEFSQQFDTQASSHGVLQLRATLLRGTELLDQRSFVARSPAPSADAAGGAQALAAATDQVATQLADWVAQQTR